MKRTQLYLDEAIWKAAQENRVLKAVLVDSDILIVVSRTRNNATRSCQKIL